MFFPTQFHGIRVARHLDLALQPAGTFHVACASRRGASVSVPAGWTSVWLALSGGPHLASQHNDWQLPDGRILVWTDGELRGHCRTTRWCLLLAAPGDIWARLTCSPMLLLSKEHACPRDLARMVVHACRLARRGPEAWTTMSPLLQTIAAILAEQQADLAALLPRCNGRTQRHRQQNLQRLLRARQVICHNPENKHDTGKLARIANYSPHHFIRIHRAVFGETPAEYASRLRTRRAWELVRHTRIPVCEVTEALGFESQSAFCRAFKREFGITTGQARNGEMPSTPGLRALRIDTPQRLEAA